MAALSSFFVAVAPFSKDISFKPFFVFYDSSSLAIPVPIYSQPSKSPNYIIGVGHGRVVVLSNFPKPQKLPKEFLDFCESLAIGQNVTKDKTFRH
jgi:hypothetical protein